MERRPGELDDGAILQAQAEKALPDPDTNTLIDCREKDGKWGQ